MRRGPLWFEKEPPLAPLPQKEIDQHQSPKQQNTTQSACSPLRPLQPLCSVPKANIGKQWYTSNNDNVLPSECPQQTKTPTPTGTVKGQHGDELQKRSANQTTRQYIEDNEHCLVMLPMLGRPNIAPCCSRSLASTHKQTQTQPQLWDKITKMRTNQHTSKQTRP